MSTKTILNRIAKVAVAALLGGLFTVVSAPATNAADAAGQIQFTIDINGGQSAGICAVITSAGAYSTFDNTSRDFVSTLAAPTTVQVALGGDLEIQVDSGYFTYTANGSVSIDTSSTLHSDYGVWESFDEGTTRDTITVTASALGTVTFLSYAGDPFTAINTPDTTYFGSENGKLVVQVVASCNTGVVDLEESGARIDSIATSDSVSFTTGDTLTYGAGSHAYISLSAKNTQGNSIPSTSTWTVSATNGAKVKTSTSTATINASTTASGTLSSVSATAGGSLYVRVTPADRAAGGTTTVTVTAAGTTMLTKTITFLPEAAKIVVVKQIVGSNTLGEGALLYELHSASGVVVPGAISAQTLTLDSRITGTTSIKSVTAEPRAWTNVNINGLAASTLLGMSTMKYGLLKYACNTGATTGSTKVTFEYTTPITETDITQEVELKCAGGLASYTISMDKASYKIGEVGTLTVTAKDSSGATVNDFTAVGTGAAIAVGGGALVKAVNNAAWDAGGDTFSGGVKTYLVQFTTAGAFNIVVNFPGSVTKSQTASYSVVDGSGAVSNAEVLAAIVKLIASINKQITKLQKLIKK